jgi:hypothetical protein
MGFIFIKNQYKYNREGIPSLRNDEKINGGSWVNYFGLNQDGETVA